MSDIPGKFLKSLYIASCKQTKVISFGFDPKTGRFIPVLNGKKSPALLDVFTWAKSIKEFAQELSKVGYPFDAKDFSLAINGKFDEIVYGE